MKCVVYFATVILSFFIFSPSFAADHPLKTSTGHELGLTLSRYDYRENDPNLITDIKLTATKIGIHYAFTWAAGNDWSLKGDFHYANGKTDYSYNGTTIKKVPDWYYDVRGLIAKDVVHSPSSVITPYIGLGYRFLTNDANGMTANTGAKGYLRENQLIYLPIGFDHKYALNPKEKLITNAELDVLMQGTQKSYLSNANSGLPDVSNDQNSGYGLRASMMYEKNRWSAGPWITYWNISKSEVVNSAWEPKNNTTEAGIKVNYKF